MYKKILFISITTLFVLFMSFSLSVAKDFVIDDYTFTWRVVKIGHVELKIQKENGKLILIFKSLGGKLATLYLAPSHTKAIGDVLLKAEEYYNKHKNSDVKDPSDTIQAGKYRVIFSSTWKGRNFEVLVRESKTLALTAVLMSKEEATKVAKYLIDADKMAALVDKLIRP